MSASHPSAEPLHQYLENRGLGKVVLSLPDVVRFHPCLDYWHAGTCQGKFPAMLCRVDSSEGRPVSIHRTYLTTDGFKAPVPCPKKLMPSPVPGRTREAAIRLYQSNDVVAITEGIETAFAVHVATDLPVWAAISAGGMAALSLPKTIHTVHIMADRDRSGTGEVAAYRLAERLIRQGHEVHIVPPDVPIPSTAKGIDWLDVLQGVSE
jgi:putative DNA primase/helicase